MTKRFTPVCFTVFQRGGVWCAGGPGLFGWLCNGNVWMLVSWVTDKCIIVIHTMLRFRHVYGNAQPIQLFLACSLLPVNLPGWSIYIIRTPIHILTSCLLCMIITTTSFQ